MMKPTIVQAALWVFVSIAVTLLAALIAFASVAWTGQKLDPAAPGDQYIFLGFVAGALAGMFAALVCLFFVWKRLTTVKIQ